MLPSLVNKIILADKKIASVQSLRFKTSPVSLFISVRVVQKIPLSDMNDDDVTSSHLEDESTICTSTIFKLGTPGEYTEKYHYSRHGNPTRDTLESSLALLDKAKYSVTYSSKAAASLAILSALTANDLIAFSDLLSCEKFEKFGFNAMLIKLDDLHNLSSSLNVYTKIVWIESPTNPLMTVADIKAIADIVHSKSKAILVVDNTFLTPYFQRPLELGADVTVISMGEFIGGHSDINLGAVTTNNLKLYEKFKYYQISTGVVPSPFDCYLANRSLKTLALRMERHSENSYAVAQFLDNHPKVKKVFHPALKSHANHEIALAQSYGHSGILSFYLKGSLKQTKRFFKALKLILVSESFGGAESNASFPWLMSHADVPEDIRIESGVTDNLVQMSIGLEDVEIPINDLRQALEKV